MSHKRLLQLIILCAAVAAPLSATGFVDLSVPPKHRILYRSLTAAQYNPLGLQSDLYLGYRRRLMDSESLVLRDTFVGGMMIYRLNPAYARIGAGVEVQPILPLTLRALYEHRVYFGSVGMMQSFASPHDEHHEDELERRADQGHNSPGNGAQVTLQAVLRAKVGPVALVNEFNMVYFQMDVPPGQQVFYVNLFDTLAPTKGWMMVNNANLLWLASARLLLGVRYTVVHALYSDQLLGARPNLNTPNHRVGPMACYVLPWSWSRFKNPMLALIINWWIDNRYRSGQQVHQAVPYGALAFQVQGDLWTK